MRCERASYLTSTCSCSYLADLSARLTTAGVPHDCARGSLDNTWAILEAARALGIPDFEGHLWLGSVLESLFLMRHKRARGRAADDSDNASMSLTEVMMAPCGCASLGSIWALQLPCVEVCRVAGVGWVWLGLT